MRLKLNAHSGLKSATEAALKAGALLQKHQHAHKKINEEIQHDIKLELDVRTQKLIEAQFRRQFPESAVFGEEGVSGDPAAEFRWIIDPIDGTVNFTYGIPHACVSIALQERSESAEYPDGYNTVIGVVHDPFCDEMWTAIRGQPARLNGTGIHVSKRNKLAEAVVSIGFAKSKTSLEASLPYFNQLVYRVRKVRMMGAAALGLAYVATGRFDAYIERGIRLWDIAAGGLIIECAGGEFWRKRIPGDYAYRMVACNGLLRRT